jgi:hypothetical protein
MNTKEEDVTNVLLFGEAGSTKSSFINSVWTMMNSSFQPGVARAGGSEKRVTAEYGPYRMGNDLLPANVRIWDVWGIERTNYRQEEFPAMLRGEMKQGTKLKGTKADESDAMEPGAKPDCVIFFIPAGELDNTASEMLVRTKEFIELANRENRTYPSCDDDMSSCLTVLPPRRIYCGCIEQDGYHRAGDQTGAHGQACRG